MDMADVAAQTLAFYLQLVAVLAGTGAVTALLILGVWRLIEAVTARRRRPPVHQTRQLAFNNTLAFKTTEELSAMEQEWRRREHLAATWPSEAGAPE